MRQCKKVGKLISDTLCVPKQKRFQKPNFSFYTPMKRQKVKWRLLLKNCFWDLFCLGVHRVLFVNLSTFSIASKNIHLIFSVLLFLKAKYKFFHQVLEHCSPLKSFYLIRKTGFFIFFVIIIVLILEYFLCEQTLINLLNQVYI